MGREGGGGLLSRWGVLIVEVHLLFPLWIDERRELWDAINWSCGHLQEEREVLVRRGYEALYLSSDPMLGRVLIVSGSVVGVKAGGLWVGVARPWCTHEPISSCSRGGPREWCSAKGA